LKKLGISEINIPDWLVKLPPGSYCIPQLMEITKFTYHRIYQRLHALNIPNYKVETSLGMGVTRPMVFYTWQGFEKESEKINKQRLEKVKKGSSR
jgi:hypothetical protein